MSTPIDSALRRLRQDLSPYLRESDVHDLGRQVGHRWRYDALLTPYTTILWFVLQVLHGNTALTHITLKARRAFTESAYCQARTRLPLELIRAVLHRVIRAQVSQAEDEGLWSGHRTFLIDGSAFSMPDTPALQRHFGQPGGQAPGCGFPVAKILALFHAGTGLLREVVAAPLRTHDMSQVGGVHPILRAGDVLVGDRGFCSFPHLALLTKRGVKAVFRIHQRQIVDFAPGRPHGAKGQPRSRWLRASGSLDQVVEWARPEGPPDWMTPEQFAALPERLVVRELRYQVGPRGFRTRSVTLVTTLLDAEAYSLDALAELYGTRWRVEQHLRELKQALEMDVLRCKTVEGVLKELLIYAMVYNLVRMAMVEAAHRQRVDVHRISFIDAMRWLLEASPGEALPRLVVNRSRPDRYEPRVRKRRPKQYPLMKKPRRVLRKQMAEQEVAA